MAIVVKFSVAPFIFLYDLCSLIKKYFTCVNLYYSTRICTLFWQITTFTKIYQKQRPYVLLWMLWFYEKVYLMYLPSIYFFSWSDYFWLLLLLLGMRRLFAAWPSIDLVHFDDGAIEDYPKRCRTQSNLN